jgi:hypothetical protein
LRLLLLSEADGIRTRNPRIDSLGVEPFEGISSTLRSRRNPLTFLIFQRFPRRMRRLGVASMLTNVVTKLLPSSKAKGKRMAALQNRNGSWRVIFWYDGKQRAFTIGEVKPADATVHKAATEELLRLLKRDLIEVPAGCSIEDFLFHRGKPPEYAASSSNGKKHLTLDDLRDVYVRSQQKKLEQTTLDGIKLHFDHLTRFFGPKRLIPALTRSDLQQYVDKRSDDWIDPNVYRKARLAKLANAKPKRNFKKPRPAKLEAAPSSVCRDHQERNRQFAHGLELGAATSRACTGISWQWARLRQDRGRVALHDVG